MLQRERQRMSRLAGYLRRDLALAPETELNRLRNSEVWLQVTRAALILVGVVVIASRPSLGVGKPAGPLVFSLVALLTTPLGWIAARRVRRVVELRWLGAAITTVDVIGYAAFAAAFHQDRGMSITLGLAALLEGPIRMGITGAAVTAIPVAAALLLWPTADTSGHPPGAFTVLGLVALISASATLVSEGARRAGDRLRQAQAQFQRAFEHASGGIAILDLDGRVVEANVALTSCLCRPVGEVVGSRAIDYLHADDRAALLAGMADVQSNGQPGQRFEVRIIDGRGEERLARAVISLADGGGLADARLVLQLDDVTERRAVERELTTRATTDPLTGVLNRAAVLLEIDQVLRRQHAGSSALLFIDLDDFKAVNDHSGHAAGDSVLVEVADRLRTLLRPGDVLGRLGGDEFLVCCTRLANRTDAFVVAQRVADALNIPAALSSGRPLAVSASVGVTIVSSGTDLDAAVSAADAAMYAAKRAGGNAWRCADNDPLVLTMPGPRRPWSDVDEAGRYRLMLDLSREVTGCLDLDNVLVGAFRALHQIVLFTGGSIQLTVDDGGQRWVRLAATEPPATAAALGARVPYGQGIGGQIIATGTPRYLPDIMLDPEMSPERRTESSSTGVRSYFGVPLVSGGEVLGLLQIDSVQPEAWSEADRLAVLAFAPIVAAALQNAGIVEREIAALLGGSGR